METTHLIQTLAATWNGLGPWADLLAMLLVMGSLFALGNVSDPVVLEKGLKTTFFMAYNAAMPIYPDLTTEVPSKAKDEKYGWLGTAPSMREWVDERVPKGLLDHEYTITNAHYEASIEVDLDDFEDDQTGMINIRVQDMGTRARRHPDSELATLVEAGSSSLCYDGQYFFDTDHVEGDSGTQSNALTYDATDHTAVTVAEFKAALQQAIQALLSFKDDRGEPFLEEWQINADNLDCMVPVALMDIAEEALTAQTINNTTNTTRNKARQLTNARLTSSTAFYIFFRGAPVRPFIYQKRGFNDGQDIRAGFLGLNSEGGFMRRKAVFGVDARYKLGYALWQFAVKTTFN